MRLHSVPIPPSLAKYIACRVREICRGPFTNALEPIAERGDVAWLSEVANALLDVTAPRDVEVRC